jgi:hypothetical protein
MSKIISFSEAHKSFMEAISLIIDYEMKKAPHKSAIAQILFCLDQVEKVAKFILIAIEFIILSFLACLNSLIFYVFYTLFSYQYYAVKSNNSPTPPPYLPFRLKSV